MSNLNTLIMCTNKGCYTQDYHKLDLDTDEVFCVKCNRTVKTTPHFKKLLKNNKQVFRKIDTSVKFSCKGCGVNDTPVIVDLADHAGEVRCASCGDINTYQTNFFLAPLRMNDQIPRLKASYTVGTEGRFLKQTNGNPLPWQEGGNKPVKAGPEQAAPMRQDPTVDEKETERLRQIAAKRKRREADLVKEAEAVANAKARLQIEEEKRRERKLAVASGIRRTKPLTAEDMLKRVGVGVLGGPDEITEGGAVRPKISYSKSGSPAKKAAPRKKGTTISASDLLARANVRDLSRDQDEEGLD